MLDRKPHHKGFKPRASRLRREAPRERRSDKAARRRRRRGMFAVKRKPGERVAVERKLRALDPQIVKSRDGYECNQCRFDGVRRSEVLDCGHLYPRSSFPAGKHLLENQFAQCRFHNTLHVHRPEYMMNWYLATHTQEQLDELHARCTGPSPTTETLKAWVPEREELLSQLRMNEMVAA